MEANSTPTAPAPTTISVLGISGSSRIERLVKIVLWSGSMPGNARASEPLTSRMLAASTLHPFHFIFLEQELDALGVFFYDLVFARQDVGPIDFQAADLEAQLRAVFEMVVNVGVVQQHFGGDAANVQAGAAEKGIFLHHDGLETQLAGTNGGYIPARSAADNRHVVLCHAQSPFRRARTCLSANGNQVDRTLAADLMKKDRIAMNYEF